MGKTKSQMFHQVLVLVSQNWIANIQPLDIYSQNEAIHPGFYWILLSNLWISTAKMKQITQASTGFCYPTFWYLKTNSRFFALHRLLLDFLIQPLGIYSENKANYPGLYWIISSNLWISTDKFKISCFTQASAGLF